MTLEALAPRRHHHDDEQDDKDNRNHDKRHGAFTSKHRMASDFSSEKQRCAKRPKQMGASGKCCSKRATAILTDFKHCGNRNRRREARTIGLSEARLSFGQFSEHACWPSRLTATTPRKPCTLFQQNDDCASRKTSRSRVSRLTFRRRRGKCNIILTHINECRAHKR